MNIKFLSGFQSVGVIIILISVGYIITSLGKCDEKINKFISWFIITIAMPCNMFLNIVKHFSTEELSNIHQSVAIPAIAMVASLIAGGVLVHFLKVRKERAGTMAVLTALNNTIFMGMPVNQAFFGSASTTFVLYYYLANTVLFWTVGVFIISGEEIKLRNIKFKKMITPPLCGVILGIIITIAGVGIPQMVSNILSNLGDMTTGLSMIFIGSSLAGIGIKKIRLDRDIIAGCIARFMIGPAISLLIFNLFKVDGLMYKVFVIQSFMPVMANQVIVAREYGADSFFASEMVLVSTVMSLIILPLAYVFV